MKMNNAIWAAIIGAAGVIAAAILTIILSPTQPKEQSTPQSESKTSAPMEKFTPRPLSTDYFVSGWMGDGEQGEKHLSTNITRVIINGTSKEAFCFTYIRGPKRWAGVYWQHPENNWGRVPGIDLRGALKITFFARGDNGGEIVEFISGSNKGNKYSDSYRVSTGQLPLNKHWVEYSLDISRQDLSSVIGAFAWSAPATEPEPLKFCVADVQIR